MLRRGDIQIPVGVKSIPVQKKERKFNKRLIRALFSLEADEPKRTQKDFAEFVGEHSVTVNRKLRGRLRATDAIADALAEWFSSYDLPSEAFFANSDIKINITLSGKNYYVAN